MHVKTHIWVKDVGILKTSWKANSILTIFQQLFFPCLKTLQINVRIILFYTRWKDASVGVKFEACYFLLRTHSLIENRKMWKQWSYLHLLAASINCLLLSGEAEGKPRTRAKNKEWEDQHKVMCAGCNTLWWRSI